MEQLYELSKRFPDKFIHDNPSGYGDYIQHSVIRQRLLSVLGAYSTDVVEIIYDGEIVTGVILQLSCVVDGQEVSVVEAGDVETVIKNPKHPYTQLLIDSIPEADPGKKWGKLDMEKTQNKILTSPSVGWRK